MLHAQDLEQHVGPRPGTRASIPKHHDVKVRSSPILPACEGCGESPESALAARTLGRAAQTERAQQTAGTSRVSAADQNQDIQIQSLFYYGIRAS